MSEIDRQLLAERVRTACVHAALTAYEDAGLSGLCAEGRWEYAISAMRQLDLNALIDHPSSAEPGDQGELHAQTD